MDIPELTYKVKDIMTTDFIKVYENDNIEDVFNKMIESYRDEVLIMDANDKIRGIFTRSDVTKIRNKGISFKSFIGQFLNRNIITISSDASAREARDIMISKNIGRIPVVQQDKVIGIVTGNNIRDTFYVKIDELFNLYNNVFDNLHEAVCICDKEGIVRYWNKRAESLYNVKREAIVDQYIGKFFPNAANLQVLKNKKRINNVCHEPVKGKLVALSAVPLYNSRGELTAVVSTDRDITEAVNLTNQLEYEKKKVEFLERAYKNEIAANYSFSSIIGKNKKIIEAISVVQKVAPTSASVLITGKSGTGKEVFAKAIHEASGRSGNFVAINCSAIPENLFESELFGYVEGAFTGAVKKGKIGKFEFASGGTLFLDEIGDMPLEMQVKILRVLQDRIIYRLGSEKAITTDTRIVAATNKDLKKLIQENKFREDLFYRLAVVQIELPPLKERKEDIKDLSNLFFEQVSKQEGIKISSIDQSVYKILTNYKWDGNIRELKNVIQRMVVLSNDGKITIDAIPEYILEGIQLDENEKIDEFDLEKVVEDIERRTIKEVMNMVNGNKQQAAKILNIKRTTLYYKLSKYEI
ncbi:sigma-54 dependent transcriptional regulator PrdR [Clostridium magnum]|uniref:Formate hydrogenlyase transcriptional activator n=1 Tax=Clostridium magnum DSM 2767 TaxID=1121326 RepID=A0A162RJW9_9CLOT|nr:sigma-54 dependent transcriptional regulator PrdR [Clostridium magnum]KZL90020.1 formate hydrogenlyase transcriptional activator [Clostridium magnum DSM 2767]SHI87824.1 PAS domain S-box-containing protein [Clostridium magnum DSM 2767]